MTRRYLLGAVRGKTLPIGAGVLGLAAATAALFDRNWEAVFGGIFLAGLALIIVLADLSKTLQAAVERTRRASTAQAVAASLLFLTILTLLGSLVVGIRTSLMLAIIPLVSLGVWAFLARGASTAGGDRDD